MKSKLKDDLKELKKQLVDPVSKQLNAYERKALKLAREFDLSSQEGRKKGRQKVDEFVAQLSKSRTNLEKSVRGMVDKESKRLEKRVTELFNSLKVAARREAAQEGAKRKKKKAAAKKKKTTTKKKKTTKKKAASTGTRKKK